MDSAGAWAGFPRGQDLLWHMLPTVWLESPFLGDGRAVRSERFGVYVRPRRETLGRGNSEEAAADIRERRLDREPARAAGLEAAGDVLQVGLGHLDCFDLGGKVHDEVFPFG